MVNVSLKTLLPIIAKCEDFLYEVCEILLFVMLSEIGGKFGNFSSIANILKILN